MIRANIYSIEPLPPESREAVQDGVGMVAAYMGQAVATRELMVRLPMNGRNHVDPSRVGFGKLDKLVELHLMAVPLDPGDDERVGLAEIGGGWGFVNTDSEHSGLIRVTTAHEAAHAFGFVLPGSKQEATNSQLHCCDSNCVMHQKITMLTTTTDIYSLVPPKKSLRNAFKKSAKTPQKVLLDQEVSSAVKDQHDFCLPCKVDMRDYGEEHVSKLRYNRVMKRKSV